MQKSENNTAEPIAIVGMGLVFPGADTPEAFWEIISSGRCMARPIDKARWPVDPAELFEPSGIHPDAVYSLSACLIGRDWQPDSQNLRLPGHWDAASLDPVFGLALHVAAAAWNSAKTQKVDRSRTSVILGNIALPTESTAAWSQELFSWEMARRREQERPLASQNPANRDPISLPARLISEALGLGGNSFTLDAACASSIYALKLGMDKLRSGRADAVLAGGLSRPDCLYTQMGFAQLHALSSGGVPRPFDERGDGLVVGEGAGIFLLKRLDDALAHGDRILGVLRAVGLSNDVSGALLAPSSEGQLRAMRAAYAECGLSPRQIDTIECHATGTPVGDSEEFRSLRTLWADDQGSSGPCTLGSVKSNIGHGLTSAGAAGLAKLLLAFQAEKLPPTAGFEIPRSTLDISDSPFRVLRELEPWHRRDAVTPRRAALSGFGFGGINAHLIVEEYIGQQFSKKTSQTLVNPPAGVAVSAIGGRIGPHEGVFGLATALLHGETSSLESPGHWYGVGGGEESASLDDTVPKVKGLLAETVAVPIGRFRIPPSELEEVLPQQALILNAAHEAARQAGWLGRGSEPRLRTAVLLGVSLDQGTNHFQLRWALTDPHGDSSHRKTHIKEARDAFGPALTANRVMGNLASIAASRLAREFRLGGPSFTISDSTDAGITALETAFAWIASGQIDEALVGAVDITSDLRHAWAAWLAGHGINNRLVVADTAIAIVLRRADLEPANQALAYLSIDNRRVAESVQAKVQHEAIYAGAATSLVSWTRELLSVATRVESAVVVVSNDALQVIEPASYWMPEETCKPRTSLFRPALRASEHKIEENLNLDRSLVPQANRIDPVGIFLLHASDRAELMRQAGLLREFLGRPENRDRQPSILASAWWHRENQPEQMGAERLSLVLWRTADAPAIIAQAIEHIRTGLDHSHKRFVSQSDYIYTPERLQNSGLAFVFPGMGSAYAGMGRALSARWPELFDHICSEWATPRTELYPGLFWHGEIPENPEDHCDLIFGQAALGMAVSDFTRRMGVEPDAMMGLSLGESVQLLASGAWVDHDELWQRMRQSDLFKTELAGPCHAARRYWKLAPDEPVDWLTVVVPKPLEVVREAIATEPRAHILIINAPDEVVLGGQRAAVERVLASIRCRRLPVGIVSTMHAPLALSVRENYYALHKLNIHNPAPLKLYSAVFGGAYEPTPHNCAEAITGLSHQTVDFVRLVRQAWQDGIRTFVEIGPGSSCSRMIQAILKDVPHKTIPLTPAKGDPVATFLRGFAELFALGYGIRSSDWARLFGPCPEPAPARCVTLRVGGIPIDWPTDMALFPPRPVRINWRETAQPVLESTEVSNTVLDNTSADNESSPPDLPEISSFTTVQVALEEDLFMKPESRISWSDTTSRISLELPADTTAEAFIQAQSATSLAHGEFQRLWAEMLRDFRNMALNQGSLPAEISQEMPAFAEHAPVSPATSPAPVAPLPVPVETPRSLSRELCLTYGRGPIAPVFGQKFAEIDNYPTRVRLPDEPLMLVDRVTQIEGEPLSMTHGRIVTEHDILPGDWYLDCNRIPVCIAVESGQADLMLSGYLGIDYETKGLAMYRLLDAVVTFHDHMPGPGEVIVYDIKILNFFRQDKTWLFRFAFDATVNGKPYLTMRDGCAGFFTPEHLAAGQGVVRTRTELQNQPGKRPADWRELVPMTNQTVSEEALDKLRQGDIAAAFGQQFGGLNLKNPVTLPSGQMRLVDRVTELDPTGGRFGLGRIRAEFDIQPEAWFMVCHFVDDRVMPGTLMFECCLHTLRIYLLRMGWVCESRPEVAMEPVTGVRSRLKCRGQVLESTITVMYEIEIKEIGYGPEPYCIADALMYADGKPIVDMRDMSLKYTGVSREEIEKLWAGAGTATATA
ncbi:MAG: beta-ketoacyl synthase N-terminal-like domain-containing protein, partial [bacterium]